MAPSKGDWFTFSISEVGETSGEKVNWAFTAKNKLSLRDLINKDAQRRAIIGPNPETALQATVMRAEILSHLAVSIVESPKAWRDSGGGLDLFDDNIVIKIYEEIQEGQAKATEVAQKEAEATKEKLRKTVRKEEAPDKE